MKILVVEPMKPPYVKDIDSGIKSLQEIVGGTIQIVYPFEDKACIVCNDEGKLLGLPMNRFLKDKEGNPYDVICGTFFVAGLGFEDLKSLTGKQIETYKQLYSREYLLSVPMQQKPKHRPSPER